jgi:hypothetical protein
VTRKIHRHKRFVEKLEAAQCARDEEDHAEEEQAQEQGGDACAVVDEWMDTVRDLAAASGSRRADRFLKRQVAAERTLTVRRGNRWNYNTCQFARTTKVVKWLC